MGQCQMELENFERALFYFEGYLREEPDAENADFVRERIEVAKKGLAAQQEQSQAEEERKQAGHGHSANRRLLHPAGTTEPRVGARSPPHGARARA